MKHDLVFGATVIGMTVCGAWVMYAIANDPPPARVEIKHDVETCFRPGPQNCADFVRKQISQARSRIDFAAYALTSHTIVDELNIAVRRGVIVRALVDRSAHLANELPGKVRTNCRDGLQHNKFIIIDGTSVLTGSYNWTEAAEHKNFENIVMVRGNYLANVYSSYFQDVWTAAHEGLKCSS